MGLQEGSDNRTGSLRYRCPDVHTGKQDQQFLLRKYSVLPHITDKHMRFSPPPANTSGGYTLI